MASADWHADLAADAYEEFFRRLKLRREQNLLDLSAGYDLISVAATQGLSVSTVDSQKEILEVARSRGKIALEAETGSYGGVLCVGTFSSLPREYGAALSAEIERVLVPGGLVFCSFAPLWARDPEGTHSVRTFFDREGRVYRRDHGRFGSYVVYQNREIETLFRKMKLVSLVTQVNGARRLIAMKKG